MRARFGEVTRHQFQDHQDVRKTIIRSSLDGLDRPIVVLGDSLIEMADFPKALCGKPVVSGGIGGATTSDFLRVGPEILASSKPAAVVVALGANDGNDPLQKQRTSDLLREIGKLSPVVITMSTKREEFNRSDLGKDGVHLTRSASAAFVSRITAPVERGLGGCD
ncbi:hypothetical protein [Bradyrhizobium arachidis]|nr:hypothetical protein [Bradyrhizobium arachidis]